MGRNIEICLSIFIYKVWKFHSKFRHLYLHCVLYTCPIQSCSSYLYACCCCLLVIVDSLLFQFLCDFLVQGGEIFTVLFGKSSSLLVGKGRLHILFLHVPCLVSLILELHMFIGL